MLYTNVYSQTTNFLVIDLNDKEDLSSDDVKDAQEHFTRVFVRRYRTSGPPFYCGSLDQAVTSMFDPNDVSLSLFY